MARSRNIKPGFFKNYELADLGPVAQLLFAGLWCLADREGRLEDKPRLIKAELFPYYECDVNGELTELERLGFVRRYTAYGIDVVEVLKFKDHQTPHNTEKASKLPEFSGQIARKPAPALDNGGFTVGSRNSNDGKTPDSLIPDSLSTDSLIPDSKTLAPTPAGDEPPPVKAEKPKKPAKEQAPTADAWGAYAHAYQMRYGEPPVRNAKVNGQLAQFVGRVGAQEAPDIARFYVGHQGMYYVRNMHPIDALLKDAEKLRTEWATGRKVTNTQAQQADRTATNHDAFAPLIEAARRAEEAI